MTNAIAIASIALSIFMLFAGSAYAAGAGKLETMVSITGIILTLYEIFRRKKGAGLGASGQEADPGDFQFPIDKGLLGGLFGGVIAAPIIATAFHFVLIEARPAMAELGIVPPPEMQIVAEIFVAAITIGAVVGIFTLGVAALFDHWRQAVPQSALIFNSLSGAILGGILAGLICGPLGTLYFGQKPLPILVPSLMLLGAVPAIGISTFAIVTYDNDPLSRQTLRNFLLAMASTGIVGVIVVVIFSAFTPEILAMLLHYLGPGERLGLLTGGLYYGAFVGASLGAVVGLTLLFIGNKNRA